MSGMLGTSTAHVDLKSQVDRELRDIFARHTATAAAYGTDFAHLWALAENHAVGGKLVRPLLMMETIDALAQSHEVTAGTRDESLRIAAAIEALHYAFLLHDDVIDGDTMRRGGPNLIGELAASARVAADGRRRRHYARSAGILAGDLLLSTTHQVFARADLTGATRTRLLDLLEHTILETTAGELVDVGLADAVITPDLPSVLAMTLHKTASYTFQLPLRAAAILAGASPATEEAMSAAGAHLGLAYQLQDDLLSTFGDSAAHGKDAFSDLREGKQTAIICFARLTSAWPAIEDSFGDASLSHDRAVEMRDLLRSCGAERFVQDLVDEQLSAFSQVLATGSENGTLPCGVRSVLLDLLGRVDGRSS